MKSGPVNRLSLSLFLMLAVTSVGAAEQDSPELSLNAQQVFESSRAAVVVIRQWGRDGGREGIGTGFIISKDGLVATCLHVIGEGRSLEVAFADGKTAEVTELYAWDRKLDLAVLRINRKDLSFLKLADSDNLKQGASVVAVGNPQGLTHSVVQGVVSALRDFEFGRMIQLAIPIEPGNSGGPLLDMRGRVQGILNMKSVVTENLGFAIPINTLKPLLERPNTVLMDKWRAMGALDTNLWEVFMGGQWRQKVGTITVEGAGNGFGGRTLCLWKETAPAVPYELAVTVKMENEAGAAGLVFGADRGDKHYGFYPSGGQLRLTRFDGPSVYSWQILRQLESPYYRPGEWNRLKVRVGKGKISCFVNDHLLTEVDEDVAEGQTGLAKFRDTKAQFRNFARGAKLDNEQGSGHRRSKLVEDLEKSLENPLRGELPESSLQEPGDARAALNELAAEHQRKATAAKSLARDLNNRLVVQEMAQAFEATDQKVDLFRAAFLIAKTEYPDLEFESYAVELERMTREIRARFKTGASAREKLDVLLAYLFQDSGYHGSRSDYYNRANSYMNRVLEDREGIPITLSVLLLELGERLGIGGISGMPFPGHFMLRFTEAEKEPIFIDVFDGGKIYERGDLYHLISERSEVPLRQEHFIPATKRDIVVRMLKNIVGTSMHEDPPARTLVYVNLILALAPDDAYERWRRVSLNLQTGSRDDALTDLGWLLKAQPSGLDLERVEELYRRLKTATDQ